CLVCAHKRIYPPPELETGRCGCSPAIPSPVPGPTGPLDFETHAAHEGGYCLARQGQVETRKTIQHELAIELAYRNTELFPRRGCFGRIVAETALETLANRRLNPRRRKSGCVQSRGRGQILSAQRAIGGQSNRAYGYNRDPPKYLGLPGRSP